MLSTVPPAPSAAEWIIAAIAWLIVCYVLGEAVIFTARLSRRGARSVRFGWALPCSGRRWWRRRSAVAWCVANDVPVRRLRRRTLPLVRRADVVSATLTAHAEAHNARVEASRQRLHAGLTVLHQAHRTLRQLDASEQRLRLTPARRAALDGLRPTLHPYPVPIAKRARPTARQVADAAIARIGPTTARSFTDLHDECDPNEYLAAAAAGLGWRFDTRSEADLALLSEAADLITGHLATRP